MQLRINGQDITIPADTSLKLTRENPYFSSSGDYTMELTIPLRGCPGNRKAIGFIHTPLVSLRSLPGKRLPMSLTTSAGTLIGHALITEVTQQAAKVQLVAGRSSFDNAMEGADRYIDKLDLGQAWDRFPARLVYRYNGTEVETAHQQKQYNAIDIPLYIRSLFHDTKYSTEAYLMMRGPWPSTDSVAFPTWSEADDMVVNIQVNDLVGTARCWLPKYDAFTSTPAKSNIRPIAPQPYLLEVIERVVKAVGYEADLSWMRWHAHPLKYIFLPNVRATFDIARMLPHWTVRDFVEHVQDTFGVVFSVNGRKVSVMPRQEYYSTDADTTTLSLVVEEFTADIDNDEEAEQKTTSAGNVSYDWDTDDPQLSLPDEVWENAEVKYFDNYAMLSRAAYNLTEEERKLSTTLYIDRSKGGRYAWLHYGDPEDGSQYNLMAVDPYGPLIRNAEARDTRTLLPIIPASVAVNLHPIPSTWGGGTTYTDIAELPPTSENPIFTPILSVPGAYHVGDSDFSIDRTINPDTDTTEEQKDTSDKLVVAWYDARSYCFRVYEYGENRDYSDDILCPLGLTYMKDGLLRRRVGVVHPSDSDPAIPYEEGPFRLRDNGRSESNMTTVGECLRGTATIDTRVQHRFSFLDNAFDPQRLYIINGRRYACAKLELTITARGISKLKTGYFYELQ